MKPWLYFNKIAHKYNKKVTSGFLGNLRKKEQQIVFNLLQPLKKDFILDAGCGSGFYSLPLLKFGCNVYGIDLSPKMVEVCKKIGINAKVANIENFNLNKKFDKILSCGVLEFCNNHKQILNNFSKHLKDNGMVVILFPKVLFFGFLYKLYHLSHGVNIRLISLNRIKKIVKETGFKIVDEKNSTSLSHIILLKKSR